MIDIVLPLAILAILCFLVYRIPYHLSSKSSGYLPTTRYHLSRPIPTPQGWTVDWTGGQLSLSTRDYNAVPRLLLGGWKGHQPLLSRFYALGGLAGILGLIGSLGGAAWAVIQVWGTVWEEFAAHSETMASSTLAKRSFADVGASSIIAKRSVLPAIQGGLSDTGTLSMHSTGLSPLIPGITIPFAHLPTIILVLVLCQLVHELGHALSASIDGVSPSKFSLNIHYALPSMTVSFSSSVDKIPTPAQIRLASAGAWHNLISFCIIAFLALSGIWRPLWSDTSVGGRVVKSVDFTSPLSSHVHPGDLITHLDDVFLGHAGASSEDRWHDYLSSEQVWDDHRGWCMSAEQWDALVVPPCAVSGEISFSPAVQEPDSPSSPRCLPPHPVLDAPTENCAACVDGNICIRPSLEERVLRIRLAETNSIEPAHPAGRKVVLWSGDRHEVLESVKVGTLSPRAFSALLQWMTVFFNYISTVSLSLFFFNLLPLPGTDGSHLLAYLFLLFASGGRGSSHRHDEDSLDTPLRAILHTPPRGGSARPRSAKTRTSEGTSDVESDLEAGHYHSDTDDGDSDPNDTHDHSRGRASRRRGERWKRWTRRGIEMLTLGLVGAWIGGWAMVALLRSS